MTIQFRRGTTVLQTRTIEGCSIGGDPNLAANQRPVDESFSSPLLDNVRMTTTSVNPFTGAALGGGASGTDTCASEWVRNTRVNNGLADFGSGNHSSGRPDGLGTMRMARTFGPGVASRIAGSVTGTLYYDSLLFVAGPRSVIEVLYMNADGDVIADDSDFVEGTGINANFSWNQTPVNETFTDGDLFGIRIRVFSITLGEFSDAVERDLVISSQFAGTFDLAPATWQGPPREIVPFAFSWTVPPGKNWHDLESLRVRIRDGQNSVFSIVVDEATGSLALVNDASGETGPFFPVGSNHPLQTSHVRLHLSDSSIVASGPTSPTVTVNLALEFKPRAAGRSYIVEVGAVDDEGNDDPFTAAGSVIVEK
jgi:hypothetical protein